MDKILRNKSIDMNEVKTGKELSQTFTDLLKMNKESEEVYFYNSYLIASLHSWIQWF